MKINISEYNITWVSYDNFGGKDLVLKGQNKEPITLGQDTYIHVFKNRYFITDPDIPSVELEISSEEAKKLLLSLDLKVKKYK